MRPKTLKLVVTFHTTAAAMAMEALCKAPWPLDPHSPGADGGLRYGVVRPLRRRRNAAGLGGRPSSGIRGLAGAAGLKKTVPDASQVRCLCL